MSKSSKSGAKTARGPLGTHGAREAAAAAAHAGNVELFRWITQAPCFARSQGGDVWRDLALWSSGQDDSRWIAAMIEERPKSELKRMLKGCAAVAVAARVGQAESAKLLCEAGADPDAPEAGWRALGMACARGRLALARVLVGAGASLDAKGASASGARPIAVAASYGRHELVAWLLSQGARAKKLRGEEMGPLGHAVQGACAKSVKLLLAAGADPEESCRGVSVLEFALMLGRESAALALAQGGAGRKVRAVSECERLSSLGRETGCWEAVEAMAAFWEKAALSTRVGATGARRAFRTKAPSRL